MKPFQPVFSIVLVILIFTENNLSAQKKQIGIDFGIGKTGTESYNPHINPFNKDNQYLDDYFKIGLCYQYTPKKVFSIKTGLYYEARDGKDDIGFIRAPLGFDFSIGRGFQFVFGFGLYSGFLISYTGTEDPGKLNFGLQRNIGIGFQLSPELNINIGYQRDFDLTTFYEQSARSPGGAPYTNVYRGYDGFISISMKFDFIKKK